MIKELKEMSLNLKDPVTEQCEELWHMYQPIVLKLCEYKLQSAPTLIEDCVQEVFADLLAYLRTGNKIGNPGAWLTKVASNKIKDIYTSENRRKRTMVSFESAGRFGDDIQLRVKHINGRDPAVGSIRLEEILARLSESDRRIFVSYYFNGMTYEEIGAAENTSSAAVKQKLSRLKIKILKQFNDE